MTDYLELLLEEQESEEVSQTAAWRRLKIPPRNAVEQDGDLSGYETMQSVEHAQGKTRRRQVERTLDEEISIENDSVRMRGLTVEIRRLRRAVRQANTRNGQSMEQSGGAFGGDAGFLRIGGRPNFKAVDYAALVDVAFARDARRYDGLPGLL